MPWNLGDITTQTHMSGSYEEIDFERKKGRGSPTESEQHIIRTTTEWAVDYTEAGAEEMAVKVS
jgi:hypothetical protein